MKRNKQKAVDSTNSSVRSVVTIDSSSPGHATITISDGEHTDSFKVPRKPLVGLLQPQVTHAEVNLIEDGDCFCGQAETPNARGEYEHKLIHLAVTKAKDPKMIEFGSLYGDETVILAIAENPNSTSEQLQRVESYAILETTRKKVRDHPNYSPRGR